MDVYKELRYYFMQLVEENHLESENVVVKARPLTPEEAIGNPEDKDYPLIIGRERMMQAEFRNTFGQAYTDMFGNFSGSLVEIANMKLNNNFRRAIWVSSLNAVMRYLRLTDKTVHCKDNEPRECGLKLVEYIAEKYGHPKIAMVGFQPRLVESLVKKFEIRVTDMDHANIDTQKYGVVVQSHQMNKAHNEWCDLIVATGSVVVNDTLSDFLNCKPAIFYGVTICGAAKILGLDNFCHCAK